MSDSATEDTVGELLPNEQELARFVSIVFKHADPKGFVSLRAFFDAKEAEKKDQPPVFISPISLGDPQFMPVVMERARQSANWSDPKSVVFCPPVVTFKSGRDAKTENIHEGVTLMVECDQKPNAALSFLREMLGDPTVVVASGGEWVDPKTGEVEAKSHVHWRLKVPTRTKPEHDLLKEARKLAAELVGADTTAFPPVHPLRWPGSWHRKGTPRLAQIVFESENEIDLSEALELLKDATGAAEVPPSDGGSDNVIDFNKYSQKNLKADHIEDVIAALKIIPNNDEEWKRWNDCIGFATWNASGASEEGRLAFHEWSAKSKKYDQATTQARWEHYFKHPPNRIGMGTLIYEARKANPLWTPPSLGKPSVSTTTDPIDLWAKFDPPSLPRGILPDIIERLAFEQGMDMGADMAGIAVSALAVCAAAIPDKIELQVKRHNTGWLEAARLWVALVGLPSTMKTPTINAVIRPLRKIDAGMARENATEREKYDKLGKEEKANTEPPKQTRLLLQDTTIEAAQEILKDSPDGVLCYQDELSGWFGAMDKYSGSRGAAKDRAFWLEAYNGAPYSVNRIGRGSVFIENLSISLIGGIQPELICKLADESVDDGLLQRLLPVVLQPAAVGRDEPPSPVINEYASLIVNLHELTNHNGMVLRFDDGAQQYRQELERKHLELQSCEAIHPKLAAHLGKYNGIFARLCVVWHCVENACTKLDRYDFNVTAAPNPVITETTARRVGAFLHGFLLPHALAFYAGVLGLSNDHDRLTAVAGYILAHKLDRLTNRDIQRGDHTMRKLVRQEMEAVFDQLDALGWIDRIPGPYAKAPSHWAVNPAVHIKFAERAQAEAERRARERKIVAQMLGDKA